MGKERRLEPLKIEDRALRDFGETEIYEHAGYILPNGKMLCFSYSGWQRDEDHRIVGQYFRKASGTDALIRFMNRGNVRVMCFKSYYHFEYIGKLTYEQEQRIKEAERWAKELRIPFSIELDDRNGKALKQFDEYVEYLWHKEYLTELN